MKLPLSLVFSKPKCKCDEVSSLMGGENEKKKTICSQENNHFPTKYTIFSLLDDYGRRCMYKSTKQSTVWQNTCLMTHFSYEYPHKILQLL